MHTFLIRQFPEIKQCMTVKFQVPGPSVGQVSMCDFDTHGDTHVQRSRAPNPHPSHSEEGGEEGVRAPCLFSERKEGSRRLWGSTGELTLWWERGDHRGVRGFGWVTNRKSSLENCQEQDQHRGVIWKKCKYTGPLNCGPGSSRV